MVNGENPYATEEQPIGTLKQNKNCPAGAIFIYTNIQLANQINVNPSLFMGYPAGVIFNSMHSTNRLHRWCKEHEHQRI